MADKKLLKQNLIAIGVFIVLTVAILIASKNEEIAEYLTQHIYFKWAIALNAISSRIPFSLFEVEAFIFAALILGLVIYMIVQFVHKNKDGGWAVLTLIILLIMIVAFAYSLIVGPIYNRKALDIQEEHEVLSSEDAINHANRFYEDFNYLASIQELNEDGTTKCPYTDKELEELIVKEYERLDSDYFCTVQAEPKRIISSYMMTPFGVEGISYLPDVEPCYNTQILSIDKVLTIAHEIAHTKGIMRENDANEVAYYILLTSDNYYLKYVGYLKTMTYVNRIYKLNNVKMDENLIPDCAYKDYKASYTFWEEKAYMTKLGNAINEIYLKINSQSGVDSYSSKDEYEKETIIDEDGKEIEINKVIKYSHVQNMIFAYLDNNIVHKPNYDV